MKTIDKKQMVEAINSTEAALLAYLDEKGRITTVAMADSPAMVFDLAGAVSERLDVATGALLSE